ncbi:MAG TPA: hypothetical protein VJU61_00525 [Polyangiaceae bacterium]|nr:hypothetical protein [Polyangiaceae bacterium]
MTSRFTLLLSMAGVLALGCSSPAEGDGGDDGPPDPPNRIPTFAQNPQPQNPVGTAGSTGVQNPANTVEQPPVQPVVQTPPVTPQGTAGSTGMPPTGAIAPGAPGSGFALTPVAGWVAAATNEAGIQGSFYPLSDATGTPAGATTITPAPPGDFSTATGSSICVSGTASQVIGTPPAYGQYWGGGVGFDLADPGNMGPVQAWTRGSVTGFRYTLTGTAIPASLRFIVTFQDGAGANTGDPYCRPITATSGTPVTETLANGSIIQACWQAGGAPLPPTAALRSLQWQVSTNEMAATPFNFCIENLTAITAP